MPPNSAALDPRGGPLPAVLDTDFIRTGLHDQLKQGKLPMSVWSAAEGSLRLFMEYDTLVETEAKLPKFARQFGVSVDELRRILNQEWLPNIDVVCLPPGLRGLDPRAGHRDVPAGRRPGRTGISCWVRHEALCIRAEMEGLRRRAVAAVW